MNIVILGGRLGADPEVRYSPAGKAMATLSLATTSRYKDGESGEWKEVTQWHRLVERRDGSAKFMKEHLSKGSEITIEGELTHRKYDDKGVTKYITEVVIKELRTHGRRQHDSGQQQSSGDQAQSPAAGGSDDGYGDNAFNG